MIDEITKKDRAWLLDFGNGLQAAVAYHEMWQVLLSPKLFDVPCTPQYCSQVLIFQNNILPVFNMATLLLNAEKPFIATGSFVGVAVYQSDPNKPVDYGCLYLSQMPQRIEVSDDDACDLPEDKKYWESLTLSCFLHNGVAIPIIDFASIFSEKINQ
jgi:hypothetical protein